MNDSILEDLHATRERLLAESGGTLAGLVARLQKEQSKSGRQLWEPRMAPGTGQRSRSSLNRRERRKWI
jgi:hypothetical protein